MDIKGLFLKRRELIDRALNKVLASARLAPKRLNSAMRYSLTSKGKRIRPILAIESCLCCGGKIEDVIGAACAIELVHTFSLIHDDLPSMDNDDYRRGKLTCHKKFGEGQAVLAGDGLLSLAFEALAASGKTSKISTSLVSELARSSGPAGMIGGQAADIEYVDKKMTPAVLNYINIRKTAYLIKASLVMGALSAGAKSKAIEAMTEFGIQIGEAFQIVDDILDNGDSVRVLGMAEAKRRAGALTKKANKSLKIFGAKADTLRAISAYLVSRKI